MFISRLCFGRHIPLEGHLPPFPRSQVWLTVVISAAETTSFVVGLRKIGLPRLDSGDTSSGAASPLGSAKSRSSQTIQIDPALLEEFGRSMRENFTSGSIPFRKAGIPQSR